MAFELGEKHWKLSLGDGARGPSRYTVTAGDTTALLFLEGLFQTHSFRAPSVKSSWRNSRFNSRGQTTNSPSQKQDVRAIRAWCRRLCWGKMDAAEPSG